MNFHFIDDNLVNYDGHNADYIDSLCNELLIRNIHPHVSSNKKLIIQENVKITYHKVFDIQSSQLHGIKLSYFNYKFIRIIWSNIIFCKNYFSINNVIKECDLNILNDLSPRNYFGFLLYSFLTSLLGAKSRFLIIFHDRVPSFHFYLIKILNILSFRHKIHYASQSKIISEDLLSRFNFKLFYLPTPQIFENIGYLEYSEKEKFNISFIGLASKAKGFDFLIKYLMYIITTGESRILKNFQFTIQISNIEKELLNLNIQNEIELIKKNKDLSTIFIKNKLNNSDYINLFKNSHCIIAPYNPSNYKFIQSGIVTQSLSCGKPIILSNGTYCSNETNELNVGVLFEYNNYFDLTEKLIFAKENYKELLQSSLKKSAIYRNNHGPKVYVDLILKEFV